MRTRWHALIALVLALGAVWPCPATAAVEPPPGFPGVPLPPSPLIGRLDISDITTSGALAECYSVELAEGDRLRVSVEMDGDPLGYLSLIGPEGAMELLADVGDYPWRLTYLVPEGTSETYYLSVMASQDTPSDYTLTYTIDREPFSLDRVAGRNRYETALELSADAWAAGDADTVLIATGADFPDAICAGGLAGATRGPILLNPPGALLVSVRDEIERLGATTVYILGGEAAISRDVEAAIANLDGVTNVRRLAGIDRYETSRLIAEEIYSFDAGPGPTFLVRGDDFADAAACSCQAARSGRPILLTRHDVLDPATKELAIRNQAVRIVGGSEAVSERVERELVLSLINFIQTGEGFVDRVSGADRYATAAEMATQWSYATSRDGHVQIGVATGEQFPDALAAGPYLARLRGCLLLTRSDSLPAATASGAVETAQSGVDAVIVGGPDAVSPGVEDQLRTELAKTVAP